MCLVTWTLNQSEAGVDLVMIQTSLFYVNDVVVMLISCVMNNGYASDFFQLYRGVGQGCPLSGLLFVLAIEVLVQAIRRNENVCGLKFSETELKLSMYADQLTAFIKDECSANHRFNINLFK